MVLEYQSVTAENYPALRGLMMDYYRAGEDADSSEAVLEGYIETLYDLVQAQVLDCRLAILEGAPIGFMIFTKDRKATDFTELPGYGTIMELSVVPEQQRKGFGTAMVQQAEAILGKRDVKGFYVCAFPKAEGFWRKLGYNDMGQVGTNDQPLWEKHM